MKNEFVPTIESDVHKDFVLSIFPDAYCYHCAHIKYSKKHESWGIYTAEESFVVTGVSEEIAWYCTALQIRRDMLKKLES